MISPSQDFVKSGLVYNFRVWKAYARRIRQIAVDRLNLAEILGGMVMGDYKVVPDQAQWEWSSYLGEIVLPKDRQEAADMALRWYLEGLEWLHLGMMGILRGAVRPGADQETVETVRAELLEVLSRGERLEEQMRKLLPLAGAKTQEHFLAGVEERLLQTRLVAPAIKLP